MRSSLCQIELDERRREISDAGTVTFPLCAFYNDLEQMIANEIPWHWHEDIEIIYVHQGTLKLIIQQEELLLHPEEGMFINTNVLHTMQKTQDNCIFYSFVLSPSFLAGDQFCVINQKFIQPLLNQTSIPYIVLTKDEAWRKEAACNILTAFENYERGDYGYEFIIREKLSHMWYLIALHYLKDNKHAISENGHVDINRIKIMMNYIHKNYQNNITLKQIAHSANISERETLRCFQKTLHLTPISYVMKYRISLAANYLKNADYSITEISMLCGFSDPGYFTKVFKGYMNVTPGSYRKHVIKET